MTKQEMANCSSHSADFFDDFIQIYDNFDYKLSISFGPLAYGLMVDVQSFFILGHENRYPA